MRHVKIKNLGKIVTGNTPSKKIEEFYKSKDIPFIKPDGLNEYKISDLIYAKEYISNEAEEKARVLNRGSVLITCIGIIGKIGIIACDRMAFNQQFNAIVPNEDTIDTKYLSYILMHNKDNLQATANAAIVPIINKTQFGEYKLYIHEDIQRQNKIVRVLDKAQELVDKRKEQIAACDELIKSLFYHMFGDPAANNKKWERGKIRDLVYEVKYGTSKKADKNNGKYPVLRMNNITYQGNIDLSDLKYVDLEDNELDKYLVYKGDILFNRTNSKELVGKTAVYDENTSMAYAGYLVRARSNERANPQYISAFLNSSYGKSTLQGICKSIVGMANINAQELQEIKILVPPIGLQNEFAIKQKKIQKQKVLFAQSLTELENNFNSLMQRAFKGELF